LYKDNGFMQNMQFILKYFLSRNWQSRCMQRSTVLKSLIGVWRSIFKNLIRISINEY